MGLKSDLVDYRKSDSVLKRIAAFVFKFTVEGTVFLLLGSLFAMILYSLLNILGIAIPPNSTRLPTTMIGFAVALTIAIGYVGWCFLDKDEYGLK